MNWQRIVGVVVWLGVVVVGAGASWYAIDRAGGEVAGGPSDQLLPSAVGTPSPEPTRRPTGQASRTPSPGSSQQPTQQPTQDATDAPAPGDTPAPPATVRRTWTGNAGSVTATCRGSRPGFVSAQPADGWVVERSDDGAVDVKFERGEEEEVRVRARCVAGAPVFTTESENEDD